MKKSKQQHQVQNHQYQAALKPGAWVDLFLRRF